MLDDNTKQLTDFVQLFNDKVRKNIKIITPQDIGQNYLLHIRKTEAKILIPVVSKRAANSEDNTIARVHTSPFLFGCILGYAQHVYDITELNVTNKVANNSYLGGYYIYKIVFDAALQPNQKLVYDQEVTDEHWLVNYSKDTRFYKCEIVGKIFNDQVNFIPQKDRVPKIFTTQLVETYEPIKFQKNTDAKPPGFYRLVINEQEAILEVQTITKQVYDENKNLKAAMLSYDRPAFTKWD
jgi:hypothetical protein